MTYRQNPVDGQIQHLPNAEQIDEAPEDGGDERGNDDKQEPVGAADLGGGRAGHADDAEYLWLEGRKKEMKLRRKNVSQQNSWIFGRAE